MLTFSIEQGEEDVVVWFAGDLDIDATEKIQHELIPQIKDYTRVLFDLKEVPFVDSSGMGLMIELVRTLTEKGNKVKIANVKEDVFTVFEMLQIPEILGKGVFV